MKAVEQLDKLVTIGICAFNEERNIGPLLRTILRQKFPFPSETVIVCDGSTDSTDSIVQEIAEKNPSIRLLCYGIRKGKSEALNTLFRESRGQVIVIVAADTQLHDGSLQYVVDTFNDPSIGMCWAKLVPLNEPHQLVNKLGHFAFRLHNRLSMKLNTGGRVMHATGDILSIQREVVTRIPLDCVNDDDYLAIQTIRKGFRVRYLPKILYRASLPSTMRDYINQRRRWVYGHRQVGRMLGKYPTVLEFVFAREPLLAVSTVVEEIAQKPSDTPVFLASLLIEVAVGILVLRDVILRVGHSPWQIIQSTKRAL